MKAKHEKLYKKDTKHAIDNFNISGYKMPQEFIKNLIILKQASTYAAFELKAINEEKFKSINQACIELLKSNYMKHFPVDIFQTGSGTSTNMNANEVISSIASSLLNIDIHPNDDVNWGQSTNCVIPSVINITNKIMISPLLIELNALSKSFNTIAINNKKSYKIGRTHLQDAVPMTIGQEFQVYSDQISSHIKKIKIISKELLSLPIGGTAVGTGIASKKEFSKLVCFKLQELTNEKFVPSKNKFVDIATKDTQVSLMGCLSALSVSLIKIANDLRLLSSGPKTGFGEISFKKLQAGSSIMPGKVNPVMCESILQIGAFVIGKNTTVIIAGQNSPLQLNIMMPLIACETIESLRILTNGIKAFREKGVDQIIVNKDKALSWVEKSSALITPLIHHPKIGYDLATKWVQEANKNNVTIREYIKSQNVLTSSELKQLLDIKKMV